MLPRSFIPLPTNFNKPLQQTTRLAACLQRKIASLMKNPPKTTRIPIYQTKTDNKFLKKKKKSTSPPRLRFPLLLLASLSRVLPRWTTTKTTFSDMWIPTWATASIWTGPWARWGATRRRPARDTMSYGRILTSAPPVSALRRPSLTILHSALVINGLAFPPSLASHWLPNPTRFGLNGSLSVF